MESLAIYIVLVAAVFGIFGLINLVKPLGLFFIRRRRHAAGVVAGSVFALLIGGFMEAANRPEGFQRQASGASADPKAAPAIARAPVGPSAQPAGLKQEELDAYFSQVMSALGPCDLAAKRANDVMQMGDDHAAFEAAKRGEAICLNASSVVRRVEIPRSAKGEIKMALDVAHESCASTGAMKSTALRDLAVLLDGDGRPSAVAAAKQSAEAGASYAKRCSRDMLHASTAANLNFLGGKRAKNEVLASAPVFSAST